MMASTLNHPGLQLVSRLFSYPDQGNRGEVNSAGSAEDGEAILTAMAAIDPILLENEYVRLFINSLPEVPCAPYGSVYLEGTIIGRSTQQIAEVCRSYGLASSEPADHIAVESEFLAWLHGQAETSSQARRDFNTLLDHMSKWTSPFFTAVEQHDQLGCYRLSAEFARRILASLAPMAP